MWAIPSTRGLTGCADTTEDSIKPSARARHRSPGVGAGHARPDALRNKSDGRGTKVGSLIWWQRLWYTGLRSDPPVRWVSDAGWRAPRASLPQCRPARWRRTGIDETDRN